ncbi:MAG: saccharopine dehydrogenase NADP-binding domain-containing protein [Candidatus Cloacimonetes bacterium]|nr:saccharopine dehydrogenase NADP-binding domain-containing protein [Candidatus Cloacimonadota bacterium]
MNVKRQIVVLGAGMAGRAIAIDLAKKHLVKSADICESNLRKLAKIDNITTIVSNLSSKENIKNLIIDADLVVSAVPGFMGFQTLQTVISESRDVVDISFFPEDCFELDELAGQKGVTAVVDCGVAPGMGNVILGHHKTKMQVESYECYVGGLPFRRSWPFQYKAPFSPQDVIEEYIRPARYIKDGKMLTMPALSEPEFMEFAEIGTLEAFNTDGLRSLIRTMDIPNMIEKTMRYPGHIDYMKMLRDCGFFQTEEIDVNGVKIKPIDLTSKLLFKEWKLETNEPEFTVMKIIISGIAKDKPVKYIYELFDKFDPVSQTSSMARTTDYAATAAVELLLSGSFRKSGINPPEYIGAVNGCLTKMLSYQKKRNVNYKVIKV